MAEGCSEQLEGRRVVPMPAIGRRVIGHVGDRPKQGFASRAERLGRQPLPPSLGHDQTEQG